MFRKPTPAEVSDLSMAALAVLWNRLADEDHPPVKRFPSHEVGISRLNARLADAGMELGIEDENPTDQDNPKIGIFVADEHTDTDDEPPTTPQEPAEVTAEEVVPEEVVPEPRTSVDDEADDSAYQDPKVPPVATPTPPPTPAIQNANARTTKYRVPEFNDQSIIRLLTKLNPKRGKSAYRFVKYQDGITVLQYAEACVKDGHLPNTEAARADIRWDVEHGFIAIEPVKATA